MDVAEDADQPRIRERPGLGLPAAVLPEVEGVGPGGREHVVVEGIVILEADRRAGRNDHDAGHELLIVDREVDGDGARGSVSGAAVEVHDRGPQVGRRFSTLLEQRDRKSTRLNSSHSQISYAVFCLKKKKKNIKNSNAKATIRENMT